MTTTLFTFMLIFKLSRSFDNFKNNGDFNHNNNAQQQHQQQRVHCEVAILGAGIAGMFAAFKLAPKFRQNLCIIEKEDRVGGRMQDTTEPGTDGRGPVFGLGPLRVRSEHRNMLAFAKALNINFHPSSTENEIYRVRGHTHYKLMTDDMIHDCTINQMCRQRFNGLSSSCNVGHLCADNVMWHQLMEPEGWLKTHNKSVADYADFQSFAMDVLGEEGYQFLKAATRHHSYVGPQNLVSMLDFLQGELGSGGPNYQRYYPDGGMSQYIKRSHAFAVKEESRFFIGQPVLRIRKDLSNPRSLFVIETHGIVFTASVLLIGIDPLFFKDVTGNIAERITRQPQFKAAKPIKSITIAAWWNTRWWETPTSMPLARIISHDNCFNNLEIPVIPSTVRANVTRAVYDDGACVETWETLIGENNTQGLANEIVRGLQQAFRDRKVPHPKSLRPHIWPNAWYFQHGNSKFTNQEIAEWAADPLSGIGVRVAMIGEGYHPSFASWSEAALISVLKALTLHLNFSFPACSCASKDPLQECIPGLCLGGGGVNGKQQPVLDQFKPVPNQAKPVIGVDQQYNMFQNQNQYRKNLFENKFGNRIENSRQQQLTVQRASYVRPNGYQTPTRNGFLGGFG